VVLVQVLVFEAGVAVVVGLAAVVLLVVGLQAAAAVRHSGLAEECLTAVADPRVVLNFLVFVAVA
jgi:hypothetical protein